MSHDQPRPAARFFYAIVPDQRAARSLAQTGEEVARAGGGRALSAVDLHITIAFVGNRPLADTRPLLPPALALPPAVLGRDDWPAMSIERLASFGRGIVWAGPQETPQWLIGLTREVRAALRAAGIGFDEKPLVPHITLARNAHRWPLTDPPPDFEPVLVGAWRLALGCSGGGPGGARYRWRTL